MTTIQTRSVGLTLDLGIDSEDLERHLAASPRVVGAELATQIDDYVNNHRLGYYPALAYFKQLGEQQAGVEPELLKAEDEIAWFVTNWMEGEVKRLLRRQFVQLRFESVLATAFTLPRVRPRQDNAVAKLAQHFTVDRVRMLIEITTAGKLANDDPQRVAENTADRAREALQQLFPRLQLAAVSMH
jgi:hypothetical protein